MLQKKTNSTAFLSLKSNATATSTDPERRGTTTVPSSVSSGLSSVGSRFSIASNKTEGGHQAGSSGRTSSDTTAGAAVVGVQQHHHHHRDKSNAALQKQLEHCLQIFESVEEQKATTQSALSAKMLHALMLSEEQHERERRAGKHPAFGSLQSKEPVVPPPGGGAAPSSGRSSPRGGVVVPTTGVVVGAGGDQSAATATSSDPDLPTGRGPRPRPSAAENAAGFASFSPQLVTVPGSLDPHTADEDQQHRNKNKGDEITGSKTSSATGSRNITSSPSATTTSSSYQKPLVSVSPQAVSSKSSPATSGTTTSSPRPSKGAMTAARSGSFQQQRSKKQSLRHATSWYNQSLLLKKDHFVKQWEETFPDCPKITHPQQQPGMGEHWSFVTVRELINHFQKLPEQPLHPYFVMRLLSDAERLMTKKHNNAVFQLTDKSLYFSGSGTTRGSEKKKSGNKVETTAGAAATSAAVALAAEVNTKDIKQEPSKSSAPTSRLIIVGDTHGQLEDVLWIFYKNGLPSAENQYLFNGDIADRGFYSIEIFLLVFSLMLIFPNHVHINRGNHEDANMNMDPHSGGFYGELIAKYGTQLGQSIYHQMLRNYAVMPLATLLKESKIFIVHGGLSRVTDNFLQTLLTLDRQTRCCYAIPDTPSHSNPETCFLDAMWADPAPDEGDRSIGISPSSRGPQLIQFGKDVTKKFLKQSDCKLVIRSHQLPDNNDGVQFHHDRRLITVFSASNYCGIHGNQGAILVLTRHEEGGPHLEVERHFSPSFEQLKEVDFFASYGETYGNAMGAGAAASARDSKRAGITKSLVPQGTIGRIAVEDRGAGRADTSEELQVVDEEEGDQNKNTKKSPAAASASAPEKLLSSSPRTSALEMEKKAMAKLRSGALGRLRKKKLTYEVKTRFSRILVENKQALWKYWLAIEHQGQQQQQQHGGPRRTSTSDLSDRSSDSIRNSSRPRKSNTPDGMITQQSWSDGIVSIAGAPDMKELPWGKLVSEVLGIEDEHSHLIDYYFTLHRFRVVIKEELEAEHGRRIQGRNNRGNKRSVVFAEGEAGAATSSEQYKKMLNTKSSKSFDPRGTIELMEVDSLISGSDPVGPAAGDSTQLLTNRRAIIAQSTTSTGGTTPARQLPAAEGELPALSRGVSEDDTATNIEIIPPKMNVLDPTGAAGGNVDLRSRLNAFDTIQDKRVMATNVTLKKRSTEDLERSRRLSSDATAIISGTAAAVVLKDVDSIIQNATDHAPPENNDNETNYNIGALSLEALEEKAGAAVLGRKTVPQNPAHDEAQKRPVFQQTSSNWMEGILANIFEKLLRTEVPWMDLVERMNIKKESSNASAVGAGNKIKAEVNNKTEDGSSAKNNPDVEQQNESETQADRRTKFAELMEEPLDVKVFEKILMSFNDLFADYSEDNSTSTTSRRSRSSETLLTKDQAASLIRTLTGYGSYNAAPSKVEQQQEQDGTGTTKTTAPNKTSGNIKKGSTKGKGKQLLSLAEFLSRLDICYTGYSNRVRQNQRLREQSDEGNTINVNNVNAALIRASSNESSEESESTPDNVFAKKKTSTTERTSTQSTQSVDRFDFNKYGSTTVAICLRMIGRDIGNKTFELFKNADKDQSGMLTEKEFFAVTEQLLLPHAEYLQQYFLSDKKFNSSTSPGNKNTFAPMPRTTTSDGTTAGIGTTNAANKIPDSLLREIFKTVDFNKTGKISYLEFLHCFQDPDGDFGFEKVTNENVDSSVTNTANVKHDEFRIALMEQICGVLYTNKQALLRVFQFFDDNHDHRITQMEFVKALKCLNIAINLRDPPLTKQQIQMMADHCVLDKDGRIDYVLFLNALCICDMQTGEIFD
ncbi:unnamed protein product [Amoebophrya sp. A120]|nr:unnamed protein product [Amoebophrya sp. A120]|eukprot:GSA120T00022607001.1